MDFGNVTTSAAYAYAMKELMPGERPTENAISLNAGSVTVEGADKGSGTNTPLKISQASNAKVSDVFQREKAEVVVEAVKVDEKASELLDKRMAEEGQPKV